MYPTAGSISLFPTATNSQNSRNPNLFTNTKAPNQASTNTTQIPPDQIPTPTSTTFDENPAPVQMLKPWARTLPKSQTEPSIIPLKTAPSTANARIISINEPKFGHAFLMFALITALIFIPITTVIWGSYHNWPSYMILPGPAKTFIDKLIIKSPIPKPPVMFFNLVNNYLQNLDSAPVTLVISTIQTTDQKKFNLTSTGLLTTKNNPQAQFEIFTNWSTPEFPGNRTTNSQIEYTIGNLILQVNKKENFQFFQFSQLPNQPVGFNINPLSQPPSNSLQNSHTPGQLALTKIRNTKITALFQSHYQTLIEKSTIPQNTNQTRPDVYQITSQFTNTEFTNFIKELIAIYQESQPTPSFSQSELKDFYLQLDKSIISPLEFTLNIDKNTLELNEITLSTQLNENTLTQDITNRPLDLNPPFTIIQFTAKLTFNESGTNQTPANNISDTQIPSQQINWRQIITLPFLQPILPAH